MLPAALDGLQISQREYCVAGERKHKRGRKQHGFQPFLLFALSFSEQAKAPRLAKDLAWRKDRTSLGSLDHREVYSKLQCRPLYFPFRQTGADWRAQEQLCESKSTPLQKQVPVKTLLACSVSELDSSEDKKGPLQLHPLRQINTIPPCARTRLAVLWSARAAVQLTSGAGFYKGANWCFTVPLRCFVFIRGPIWRNAVWAFSAVSRVVWSARMGPLGSILEK